MSKKKKAKQKELDSAKLNKQTAVINIITAIVNLIMLIYNSIKHQLNKLWRGSTKPLLQCTKFKGALKMKLSLFARNLSLAVLIASLIMLGYSLLR